jgi:hypothetical protein
MTESNPETATSPLPGDSGRSSCSAFLRDAVEKQLEKLRSDCAVKRLIKRNAFGRRWALSGRGKVDEPSSSDKYWDDRQAAAQHKSTEELESADQTLTDFIAEHRQMMGADWIGNDHGRLCWAPFAGGLPIDQHYCQMNEGHEGNHCNHLGAWPQGVTNSHEWHRLLEQNVPDEGPLGTPAQKRKPL